LIVLDSSAWLEFFSDGRFAKEVTSVLRRPEDVLTPTVAIYEVYKWMKRQRSDEFAEFAVVSMKKTRIIDLTESVAMLAAELSVEHRLPMADAIMLATARTHDADLITTDADFSGIARVTVFAKRA
jgi:predicted nucleic acid-binding protein